jgi:hypothetical protein
MRMMTRIVALAACLFVLWPARGADTAPDDRRVVFVTIDGLRWQEVFGGAQEAYIDRKAGGVQEVAELKARYLRGDTPEARREAFMPFLWTVIAKQGQVFGDPTKNARAHVTNGKWFSYPGYAEMLCGFADARVDSNDKVPNPNVNVLEWLNTRPGFSGRVSAYGTWDVFPSILNVGRSKLPVVAGWELIRDEPLTEGEKQVNSLLTDLPRLWPGNAFDLTTARGAMEHLRKRKPRVLYVAFGETDEWAHMRRYDCYLDAARHNDDFLRELWAALQSMPEYAGKTSLLITTDHGRGDTTKDWTDHGEKVPAAGAVWMAVMGPGTPALGVRANVEATQSQIAATLAALVGEDFRAPVPQAAPPLPLADRNPAGSRTP